MVKQKNKNLFIDTNIWLSMYDSSPNNLNQFKKLLNLLDSEFNLIITQQVCDEFVRNRDKKLKKIIEEFANFKLFFPNVVKEYKIFQKIQTEYEVLKNDINELKTKLDSDMLRKDTPIDEIINLLFTKDWIKNIDDDIVKKAEIRYKKGNPPGKENSFGDAINWEWLLQCIPDGQDLYIISKDKDFSSNISQEKINTFLEKEWIEKKNSNIMFYNTMSSFITKWSDDAIINEDFKQDYLIAELEDSEKFKNTHDIIRQLKVFDFWSDWNINKLCEIAITNFQVNAIFYDTDIIDFYRKILKNKENLQTNIYVEKIFNMLEME